MKKGDGEVPFLLPSLSVPSQAQLQLCSQRSSSLLQHQVKNVSSPNTQQVFSCHIRLPASLQIQSSSSCFSFSLYSSSPRVDAQNVKAGQHYNHCVHPQCGAEEAEAQLCLRIYSQGRCSLGRDPPPALAFSPPYRH